MCESTLLRIGNFEEKIDLSHFYLVVLMIILFELFTTWFHEKTELRTSTNFFYVLEQSDCFYTNFFLRALKSTVFFCSVMYILKPFSIYDFRAENGLKNAKSKNTGIISSKNTVAGQKDLIKWPNVSGPTLQSLVTLLAFQQKLKREKSNLSVQTVLPQEKKLKL